MFPFIAECFYRFFGLFGCLEKHEETTVNELITEYMVGITGRNKSKPGQYSTPENIQEIVNAVKLAIVDTLV